MGGGSSSAANANAAHLMQFNPFMYYQLQLAQQAIGKKSC